MLNGKRNLRLIDIIIRKQSQSIFLRTKSQDESSNENPHHCVNYFHPHDICCRNLRNEFPIHAGIKMGIWLSCCLGFYRNSYDNYANYFQTDEVVLDKHSYI